MANRLTLAVAGSRKTQGLVEHCAALPVQRRVLVLTFTQTNQTELRARLNQHAPNRLSIEVLGWYTFLLRHFARPFLPFLYPGRRVQGFNFEGRPQRMAKGWSRFFDASGAAYASELGRLAHEVLVRSQGHLLKRLACLYDEILIDEVQDLSGYDWDIVDALLQSSIDVWMVGDIRQAVLSTNPRGARNRQYAYAKAIDWFRVRQARGQIEIVERATTWRCRPEIAAFSDSIFDPSWAFPQTVSENHTLTGHDGLFLLESRHVQDYVARFRPQCLRSMSASGKQFHLPFLNFKLAKGTTHERVLIVPTAGIEAFLRAGTPLQPGPAASFYVAVTRAAQSAAIVLDRPGLCRLPYWHPPVGDTLTSGSDLRTELTVGS